MQANDSFDVVVVGASVAGSTTAALLAAAGFRVALVDKATFPRRKACGEGLSGIGTPVLRRLGVYQEILKLPHQLITGYRILDNGASFTISAKLLHGPTTPPSIGIERRLLDFALLQNAIRNPTLTFFEGQKAKAVCQSKVWNVSVGERMVKAPLLVAADGAHSSFATDLTNVSERNEPPRYGISFIAEGTFAEVVKHVTIIPEDRYEIFLTPVSGNRLNVAVLFDKQAELPWQKNQSKLEGDFVSFGLKAAARQIGFIGECVAPPLGAGPFSMTKRSAFQENVFFVGDACTTFDPIGGMGMTHALHSGALAADTITSLLRDSLSLEAAGALYKQRHDMFTFRFRQLTKLSYWALKTPWGKSIRRTLMPHRRFDRSLNPEP